jgi:6-pyruvoyltetrahydropterin/6-carboxytetrahydropterin synthase
VLFLLHNLPNQLKVSVTRKAHFNAAHRLNNPNWDEAANQKYFGKCNNPNYHGHNYVLDVTLSGIPDPETGYVFDMGELRDIIEKHIEEKFDHKNLNLDTAEFADLNPSAENIAIVIWKILRAEINSKYTLKVKLYETERNFVECDGN